MSTSTDAVAPTSRPAAPAARPSLPERAMHRLLRVTDTPATASNDAAAHRAFRTSVAISGLRCLITYLLVPIVIPLVNVAGVVAAPIGIALCAIAVLSGVTSLRRFWSANHRLKWVYTWFMVAVFVILTIALVADINRLVAAS